MEKTIKKDTKKEDRSKGIPRRLVSMYVSRENRAFLKAEALRREMSLCSFIERVVFLFRKEFDVDSKGNCVENVIQQDNLVDISIEDIKAIEKENRELRTEERKLRKLDVITRKNREIARLREKEKRVEKRAKKRAEKKALKMAKDLLKKENEKLLIKEGEE